MKPLLGRLESGEVLLADGAMGTMLFRNGLKAGECPEAWNLEKPGVLEDIARQYHEAGSDIVQTNTFGGSPLKLAQYSLENRTEDINRAAVRAVRGVVGDNAYLSLSCGPCGRILKPYGDADAEEVYDSFVRQITAAVAEGVDLICVETMIDLNEAVLAVRAAREVAPDLPLIATMTFDRTPRGFFTVMGVDVEAAANGLREAGADVIGSNCGNGSEGMVEIASEFRAHTDLPLIIQANAGLPEVTAEGPVWPETPEFMAGQGRRLIEIGVTIIGGCCGTTPAHIAAMRRTIDNCAKI